MTNALTPFGNTVRRARFALPGRGAQRPEKPAPKGGLVLNKNIPTGTR